MSYLGAVGHKLPPETLQKVVASLVKAKADADSAIDRVVDETPLLSRGAAKEWAFNFKNNLQAMVVQAITPTASGFYPWETRPQILDAIANYINTELKDIKQTSYQLLSIEAGFRQAAKLATQAAAGAGEEILKASLESMEKLLAEAQKKPIAALVAAGGLAAALFVLWKLK